MTRVVFHRSAFKILYQKYKRVALKNCCLFLIRTLSILVFKTSLFSQNQDAFFQKWKLIEFYSIDTVLNGHIDSSKFSANQARRCIGLINSVSDIKEEGIEFFSDSTFQEYYVNKRNKKKKREHGYFKQYMLISDGEKTTSEIILCKDNLLIIYYDKSIWVYIPRSASTTSLTLPDDYMMHLFSNWSKTKKQIQTSKR